MSNHRPVLISVMQFEEALKSGATSVFQVIEMAQEVGADGVELRRETWPHLEDELGPARARLEEPGLLVTYATHATLFTPSADGQQTLRQDIETAAALGAPLIRFFPGQLPDGDDDVSWAMARDVIDFAAERGVTVALENYARTPGGTLTEIQAVLERLDTPWLMTNLDVGNYWLHNQDVVAAVQTLAPRIVSAHLKDQTGVPGDPPTVLGAGVLPLDAILDALDALPQPVTYIFEFRGGEDPVGRIEQSLAYLRGRLGERLKIGWGSSGGI